MSLLEEILLKEIKPFSVYSKGAWLVLEEDIKIHKYGITHLLEFGDSNGPVIDLEFPGGSLAQAFDAIVDEVPPMLWDISGQQGDYFLSFSMI